MDGFDTPGKTKLIMATNGSDTLDPALLFPERLDRKIEIAPLGVDYTVPVAQKNYIIFLTTLATFWCLNVSRQYLDQVKLLVQGVMGKI